MRLALEMGRGADAVKVAEEYTKRRSAWTPDYSLPDPRIYVLQTKYRAGAIAREQMQAERARWLADEAKRTPGDEGASIDRGMAWLLAYAEMAVTKDDAKEALDALSKLGPIPSTFDRGLDGDDAVGTTYLLAGAAGDAVPYLKRAAGTCLALDRPLAHMHAALHLGQALEAVGDRGGACSAYGRILTSWGSAKLRSVSLEEAKTRSEALRCDR
jgi:serine/threonine-protein kinase